jgi:outer membrane receptor protein involved in Fe transport
MGPVGTLRLRAAYGQSGQQPQAYDAIRTFSPVPGPSDVGTVTPDNLGNPDLGPEKGKEFEIGFEAGLFDERLGIDFTYYDQTTEDAILQREIAPSSGFAGLQFVNAGEIKNSGVELLLTADVWRAEANGLELSLNVGTNSNEVVSLGEVTDEDFISVGGYIQHRVGYPVGSWFSPRVVSAELGPDGVATNLMCDNGQGGTMSCDDDGVPDVYLGRTVPKVQGGFGATLTVFERLRFFGQLDFKSGFSKIDGNYRVRCYFFSQCEENWFPERFDPALIAEIQDGGRYAGAIIDEADFAKLREVSVSYLVPDDFASRIGASGATVTLAGRNLMTWSDFKGLEPESTFNGGTRGGSFSLWEQNVLPQLAQFVATINVRF